MAKTVVLEEGADCIIIRSTDSSTIKTIPYTSITQFDKRPAPGGPSGSGSMDGFLLIRSDGRETKINFDTVLTPAEADLDALYAEVYSWVYSDAAPTAAPTTAATTTGA